MLERPNRRDWKSRRGAISSWVQIPSSPPTLKTPSALFAARLSMQSLHLFATLSVRRTPTCRERAVAEAMKASKIVSTYLVKSALAVAVLVGLLACVPGAATGEGRLRLATTTSLYDTGLWDTLERRFEDRYNVELDILTGGTGKALEFGRLGEVDALAIHDRVREEAFVAEGYGVERHPIAYNYFLIVGPESDPAGISKLAPEEALSEVMRRGQGSGDRVWFVSRGDESGTHAREKLLWEKAGLQLRYGEGLRRLVPRVGGGYGSRPAPRRREGRLHPDGCGHIPRLQERPGLDAACGKWRLSPERVLRDSGKP